MLRTWAPGWASVGNGIAAVRLCLAYNDALTATSDGLAKRPPSKLSFSVTAVYACVLAGLVIYCYWFGISEMWDQWTHDEDMGHGFLVPLIAVWIAWRGRARWFPHQVRPTWWGFVPLSFASVLLYVAIAGAGKFVACIALLCAICSVILTLGGSGVLRALAFPLLLLLFMLPKLAILYNQITLPLQLLATRLAAFALSAGGVQVVRSGNILHLTGFSVSVVEACSGVRYLLALGFFAAVYAYIAGSGPWIRLALVAIMAPLAILANALRVVAAALMGSANRNWAEGPVHTASGWAIFVAAMLVGAGLHWSMERARRRLHG